MQTILFPGPLPLVTLLLIVNVINPSFYAVSCIFSLLYSFLHLHIMVNIHNFTIKLRILSSNFLASFTLCMYRLTEISKNKVYVAILIHTHETYLN